MAAETKIVLIHGAWGSPEMWQWVIDELGPLAADAVTVDLPTMQRADATLADDVATVVDAAGDGPVVLVAHSYGGTVATEAGPRIPGLTHVVYVAAAVPDVGESMFDWVSKRPDEDAMPLEFKDDGTAVVTFVEDPRDHPMTVERIQRLEPRPWAVAAVMQPLEHAAWRSVPTTYLVATSDRVIDPETQREMAARTSTVTEIAGDHMLNLCCPAEVAAAVRNAVGA